MAAGAGAAAGCRNHLNGACRTPGDWTTCVSVGLWTRHGPDNSSSSVLDYAVISGEHFDTVVEMIVDEHGVMGGDSDHSLVITRVQDKFIMKSNIRTAEMGIGGKFLRCLQSLYEGDYVKC